MTIQISATSFPLAACIVYTVMEATRQLIDRNEGSYENPNFCDKLPFDSLQRDSLLANMTEVMRNPPFKIGDIVL